MPKFEKEHGLSPEEREWLDLLCNSKDKSEVPETQNEAVLAAYERLRVCRTPKEILAKMEDRMVTQFDIDCCIDDALRKGQEQERKKFEADRASFEADRASFEAERASFEARIKELEEQLAKKR